MNKVFFINSNIFLDDNIDFSNIDNILQPLGGNTGNSYITYALIKEMGYKREEIEHIQNIYRYDFANQDKDIEIINNECSAVFLILQDLIRIEYPYGVKIPYDKIIGFLNKINKPIVIAGLGTNSTTGYGAEFYKNLDAKLIKFLKVLAEHSIEIGVRGQYSKEVLEKLGITNTRVIGCPSFYENGKNRIIQKHKNINKILLTSNNFQNNRIQVQDVICQDYTEKNILNSLIFNQWNTNIDYSFWKKMKNKKYHLFTNIEEWKNFITNFDFAIGCRLHGTIIALNSGVPAVCVKNDYRTKEMCEFLHIPYYWSLNKNTKIETLYKTLNLSELNENYNALYENYVDFLNKNNLHIAENSSCLDIKQPRVNIDYERFNQELNKQICNKKLSLWQKIFSIQTAETHKIVSLLGIKFKAKIHHNSKG